MKKKTLFTSIMTIALCLCLIAGGTFALFTSSSKVGIGITAGKVDVEASLENLKLYSAEAANDGTLVDEFNKTYAYVEKTDYFTNGGTAEFDEETATLTIDRITPGDKISFDITRANKSDVAIQYRYIVECLGGFELMSGLIVTINGTAYESLSSYTSEWELLPAEKVNNNETALESIPVSIELPISAGNEYQEKSTEIRVVVEAVQGNASVDSAEIVTYIEKAATAEAAATAIADSSIDYVLLGSTIEGAVAISGEIASKTIDAGNNAIAFTIAADAVLNDVTLTNLSGAYTSTAVALKSGAKGELSITNSTITTTASDTILGGGHAELTLNVADCAFSGGKYGIRTTGALNALSITNTSFESKSGWVVMLNGTVMGPVAVDGCTFTNCTQGILKGGVGGGGASGTVEDGVTFTNNTLTGCAGHDGLDSKYFDGNWTGTHVATGNVKDGADWTPDGSYGFE